MYVYRFLGRYFFAEDFISSCHTFPIRLGHKQNSLRVFFGIFFRYGKHFFVKDDKQKLLCKEGRFLKLINFLLFAIFTFLFVICILKHPKNGQTRKYIPMVVKTVLCSDITLSRFSFPGLRLMTGV